MNKISWFVRRISVMNAREINHRIKEQFRLAYWNMQLKLGLKPFVAVHSNSFPACTKNRDSSLPMYLWKPVSLREVESIASGKVALYGGSMIVDRTTKNCWHTAPETGKQWPSAFFNSIDYREGNPFGDVRIAWEASRLQHLVTLALYIKQNPETELRPQLLNIIVEDTSSWYTENPLMRGIHYVSSMECAMRIMALTVTFDLIKDHLADDHIVWGTLTDLVLEHAFFVKRRLSLHSSTGNHTLAEAAGLIFAGVLLHQHAEAGDWLATGLALFPQEFEKQIDSQGVGTEQAPQYTVQILDYALLIKKLLEHNDIAVPQALDATLTCGIRDTKTVKRMLGTIPPLGDSDSGSAISPYFDELWQHPIEANDDTLYSNGSLSIMQGQGAMAEFSALVDHGPLGMPPKYSHGHADALSVMLYLRGRAILVDPGTYSYTGEPRLRNYFRSTRAHNTATIDNLDQATSKMLFMWSEPYKCTLLHQCVEDSHLSITASHDGYHSIGVNHVRRVLLHHQHGLVVFDDFMSSVLEDKAEHLFNLYWHIDGDIEKGAGKEYILSVEKLTVSFSDTLNAELITSSNTDGCGWKSTNYYSRESINTLILSGKSQLPYSVVTAFSANSDRPTKDNQWWDGYRTETHPVQLRDIN